MKVIPTEIPDVLVLAPRAFADERGFFQENYNRRTFRDVVGIDPILVQDNRSRSEMNVLRELH